jgi:hypothetical protein
MYTKLHKVEGYLKRHRQISYNMGSTDVIVHSERGDLNNQSAINTVLQLCKMKTILSTFAVTIKCLKENMAIYRLRKENGKSTHSNACCST